MIFCSQFYSAILWSIQLWLHNNYCPIESIVFKRILLSYKKLDYSAFHPLSFIFYILCFPRNHHSLVSLILSTCTYWLLFLLCLRIFCWILFCRFFLFLSKIIICRILWFWWPLHILNNIIFSDGFLCKYVTISVYICIKNTGRRLPWRYMKKTIGTARKMAFRVRASMEPLTVFKASYKPLPLPKSRLRCQPPLKQTSRRIPCEMVTVHNDSYRARDYAVKPIKRSVPQDHNFLVAEGNDRFHCTTYELDYSVKAVQPGNYIYIYLYGSLYSNIYFPCGDSRSEEHNIQERERVKMFRWPRKLLIQRRKKI